MKEQKDHPFFCYLSWGPPHTPYRPPPEHERFAKMDKYPWRPNVPEKLRDTPKMLKDMGGYLGLCETLDQAMGTLLKGVDELGLTDNTLVVFTADHGDMHGSHALYFKSKPQEESLHIPLFMRMPGKIQPNQKLTTLASSIDLGPTMMSLCGLTTPQTVTGRDLSGAVLGKTINVESVYAGGAMRAAAAKGGKGKAKAQDAAAKIKANTGGEPDGGEEDDSTPGGEWRALVTPTHKLISHVNGSVHLYDLEHDPYEMKDLAADRQSEALKTHLTEEMKRWAKQTGDPYPEVSSAAKVSYSDDEAKAARGG
jgi:arylsulfatase A-like enzyme